MRKTKLNALAFTELVLGTLDGNPNNSQACGKTATATYNGKSITIGIVDRCYACGYDDIDLAPAAFQQFADLSESKMLKLHISSQILNNGM